MIAMEYFYKNNINIGYFKMSLFSLLEKHDTH